MPSLAVEFDIAETVAELLPKAIKRSVSVKALDAAVRAAVESEVIRLCKSDGEIREHIVSAIAGWTPGLREALEIIEPFARMAHENETTGQPFGVVPGDCRRALDFYREVIRCGRELDDSMLNF